MYKHIKSYILWKIEDSKGVARSFNSQEKTDNTMAKSKTDYSQTMVDITLS